MYCLFAVTNALLLLLPLLSSFNLRFVDVDVLLLLLLEDNELIKSCWEDFESGSILVGKEGSGLFINEYNNI